MTDPTAPFCSRCHASEALHLQKTAGVPSLGPRPDPPAPPPPPVCDSFTPAEPMTQLLSRALFLLESAAPLMMHSGKMGPAIRSLAADLRAAGVEPSP